MKAMSDYQRGLESSQCYHLKEMLIDMVKSLPYGKKITISRIGEGNALDPESTNEVEINVEWVEANGEIRPDATQIAQVVYKPSLRTSRQ